jgi:hypothetical protein
MNSTFISHALFFLLVLSSVPGVAARLENYSAGMYIAEYDKNCYAVTIKEIPSKSTLRFRRMGMIEVPCSGTGALPRISGTWRKGIESHTGTCFLELEIPLLARGSRKQILMAQTNKDCR